MARRAQALPLYAQIKATLQREIEEHMQPGDTLPTEPELEKRFGVSRITVRRALDELEAEGLLLRIQGRGTFVREAPITQELTQLLSWTLSMRQQGYEPRTMSCEIDVIEPTREQAAQLQLGLGQRVMRIRRLRYASGEPMCLMTNYLPEGLLPDLTENDLVEGSLYLTLLAHQQVPVRATDKVEARAATEWEARQLNISLHAPLLQVTRVSYDKAGHVCDIAVVSSRADRYSYSIEIVPRPPSPLLS